MEPVIARHRGVEQIEAHMLNQPQVNCSVTHHFGPGVYMREGLFPANTFILGQIHKTEHLNMLLKGSMVLVHNGGVLRIDAPYMWCSTPGRKLLYAITECVLTNIFATDETDLDKLENLLVEKSDTYLDYEGLKEVL